MSNYLKLSTHVRTLVMMLVLCLVNVVGSFKGNVCLDREVWIGDRRRLDQGHWDPKRLQTNNRKRSQRTFTLEYRRRRPMKLNRIMKTLRRYITDTGKNNGSSLGDIRMTPNTRWQQIGRWSTTGNPTKVKNRRYSVQRYLHSHVQTHTYV